LLQLKVSSDDVNAVNAIVDVCKRLSDRHFVANHDGNVTCKIADGQFLATPTSFAKIDISAQDLLTIDDSGRVLAGSHKIFSEIFWHLAIYRARPDIKCIVHAHPVTASAYGLAQKELGTPAIPEAIVSLGRAIHTARFFSPLDPVIKEAGSHFEHEMSRVLFDCDAFIAPGNGVWAVGENVLQTYLRLELVEHVAQQQMIAERLGNIHPLPRSLIDELMAKRPKRPTQNSPLAVNQTSPSVNPPIDEIKDLVRHEIAEILNRGD
jgi:L-fuculose-phosphate aldolase